MLTSKQVVTGKQVTGRHRNAGRSVRQTLSAGIIATAGAVIAMSGAGLSPAGAQVIHPTVGTVVRPVHANGTPAAGYRVTVNDKITIDCADGVSLSAVDPNIRRCSPSSANALSCWKSSNHTALCMVNPLSHTLARFRYSGRFDPIAALKHRVPQEVVLQVDDRCLLRDGGAWNPSDAHPDWSGHYSCYAGSLYGPKQNAGLDENMNPWIAHVLSGTPGHQHVHDARVGRVYYVGNAA